MIDMRIVITTYTLICLMVGSLIGYVVAVIVGVTKNRCDF